MRSLWFSALFFVILAPVGHADVIVNDRAPDPPGVAQYRPSLAVVHTLQGNQQVCVWQEQRAGNVHDFRVAISTASQFPTSWVQHGAPPAPAGYDWLEDLRVGSTSCTGGDGNFIVVGQVRTNAASPFTFGIGMVTGHVVDENNLTWGTPRVLITFGSQASTGHYVNGISLATIPCSQVVYVAFMNLLITSPYQNSGWFLRSADNGTTWDAPKWVGNDSSQVSGPFTVQVGAYAGRVTFLWESYDGTNSQIHSATSADWGTTLSAPIAGPVEPGYTMYSPIGVLNSAGPRSMVTEAVFTSHYGSLFYASGEQVRSDAITFPNPALSPSLVEHEPNNHPAQATLVSSTAGVVLRGTLGGTAPNDSDFFSFPLTAGQSVML